MEQQRKLQREAERELERKRQERGEQRRREHEWEIEREQERAKTEHLRRETARKPKTVEEEKVIKHSEDPEGQIPLEKDLERSLRSQKAKEKTRHPKRTSGGIAQSQISPAIEQVPLEDLPYPDYDTSEISYPPETRVSPPLSTVRKRPCWTRSAQQRPQRKRRSQSPTKNSLPRSAAVSLSCAQLPARKQKCIWPTLPK